jgi:hypothetical protein
MSSSSPQVTAPVTFPARIAWLQNTIKARVRPYHLVMGVAVGLITTVFAVVVAVLILIATNFNVLGWVE